MKVILSIESVRWPMTGIGQYTYHLATHLQAIKDIEPLRFWSAKGLVVELPQENKTPLPQENDRRQPNIARRVRSLLLRVWPLVRSVHYWHEWRKQRQLRHCTDDVFHGPNFYLPDVPGPKVCTLHDLSIYKWAHCHPPERVRYLREQITKTLERADHLITDSAYTRHEIIDYFAWPSAKITAIPLACSTDFKPRSLGQLNAYLQRYSLQAGCYSLFVGTIEPRKNIALLLDAYEQLSTQQRQRWPLLIVGHRGWKSEALHQRMQRAQAEGWLRYLGFVAQEDLPLLYAGARLFLFPSLYEGFGLPVLEAMASGVPVVCSNAASLPEVVGEAACLCDPHDVQSWQLALERGLEDEAWRQSAITAGLTQASLFSWDRCAQETAQVYRQVSR